MRFLTSMQLLHSISSLISSESVYLEEGKTVTGFGDGANDATEPPKMIHSGLESTAKYFKISDIVESNPMIKSDAFMTITECQTQLLLNPTGSKHPLFWSGCQREATDATRNANLTEAEYPQLAGYSVISDLLPADALATYKKQFVGEPDDVQNLAENAFWSACSEALASLAEGKVFVMLPLAANVLKDDRLDWAAGGAREGSTFILHEYPRLCNNRDVTHLIHLSSIDNTFDEDLTDKLLEVRQDGCPTPADIPTLTSTSNPPQVSSSGQSQFLLSSNTIINAIFVLSIAPKAY